MGQNIKKIAISGKAVQDHTQRAVLNGDSIDLINRCGRKIVSKCSFKICDYEKAIGGFALSNKNYKKRKFIESLNLARTSDTPEGICLKNRIIDCQQSIVDHVHDEFRKNKLIHEELKNNGEN